MSTVAIRVPGSTSNCGAGFDTLGLALNLHNVVTVSETSGAGGEPETAEDARAAGLVAEVVAALQAESCPVPAGFSYHISGDVPPSRGLGSSVTVLAGVMAGLNHLAGSPLGTSDLVRLLTRIEGHPDNAVAGVMGGFCVARCGANASHYVDVVRRELPPELKFVVSSPELEIATKGSRGVLPQDIRHGDAVRSINSVAFLTAALVAESWDQLRGAAEDFMHEPYRLPSIPGGSLAIRAGLEAGGLTGWLSGSGSSVLCVAKEGEAPAVAQAMTAAFAEAEVTACSRILAADNVGLVVNPSS